MRADLDAKAQRDAARRATRAALLQRNASVRKLARAYRDITGSSLRPLSWISALAHQSVRKWAEGHHALPLPKLARLERALLDAIERDSVADIGAAKARWQPLHEMAREHSQE